MSQQTRRRLTPTMLRHLREMDDGSRAGLVWYAHGQQARSAEALAVRGLVRCENHALNAYLLTEPGRRAARSAGSDHGMAT